MSSLLSVLIIVVCALLIIVVLVQNSKGGGLANNFSSSNQVMGVRRTADFIEKATWGLAITLLVLCLLATPKKQVAGTGTEGSSQESITRKKAESVAVPSGPVNNPAQNPAGGNTTPPPAGNPPANNGQAK